MESDHLVATHARAAMMLKQLARGRSFMSIHEDPTEMLVPVQQVYRPAIEIVSTAIEHALYHENRRREPNLAMVDFLAAMLLVAHQFIEAIDNATECVILDPPSPVKPPTNFYAKLWSNFRAVHERTHFNGDTLRAVIDTTIGKISHWSVQVDDPKQSGGETLKCSHVVVMWRTGLPVRKVTVFCDATSTAEKLSALTEREVIDITPRIGHLVQLAETIQYPHDITRRASDRKACNLLRTILKMRNATRAGVIGHSGHIRKMFRNKETVLDAETRARVSLNAYFGEGLDRASNAWLECDVIVVLGTPRVSPSVVRSELLRVGNVDAANRDGRWGERLWEGLTTDRSIVRVTGRGYQDDEWNAACKGLVRAALVQAAGRGRGILIDGIPVVVLSTENTGLPLASLEQIAELKSQLKAVGRSHSARLNDMAQAVNQAFDSLLGKHETMVVS